ncbi:hypothetical protein BC826DRAFT_888214, partial [Russula brevipes]
HTGENTVDTVWDTLGTFGIQEKIIAFMADNVSPMDTFVNTIVSHMENINIVVDPLWAWLWCMPHTIHLA